jgi:hypothetical protein
MGGDVLFDCDLHADAEPNQEQRSNVTTVNQVI